MSKSSKPIPLSMPNELIARVRWVAHQMKMSQQAVIRLAIEVGLEDLKRCDYDIAAAVVDRVRQKEGNAAAEDLALLAETPPHHGFKKKAAG